MIPTRLICFTRQPQAGSTKTRLIPALGADGAAALHGALIRHLLDRLTVLSPSHWHLELRYAGSGSAMRQWLGQDHDLRPQGAGDLGERMLAAFSEAQQAGATRTILFGTDVPDLSVTVIRAAARALETHDVVLGPAQDGGYYLVGLTRPRPELFLRMQWSTSAVLAQTLERAQGAKLKVAMVDTLQDIDEPSDLALLRRHPHLHQIALQYGSNDIKC